MRLLIVDDDKPLAEATAELLQSIDQQARCIETISVAADLDSAIRLLPGHDVVLCDGQFPVSQDTRFIEDAWSVVRREAGRRGIHFVLYSANRNAIDDARVSNIPAIAKPAAVEEIYTELTKYCIERWLAAIRPHSGH
jgi:CheY-like chemotaxis protein